MLLEREPDLPNALALAALLLLLHNPLNLFDPGFQLSFATVLSILLLMPFAEETLARFHRSDNLPFPGARQARKAAEVVAGCFFLAVAAQIGAAPLVAYYYHDVSLVSLLANTLGVPLIAFVIALGFGAAALGAVSPLLSWPLDVALKGLLTLILGLVTRCATLSSASLSVEPPSPFAIVAYYALIWSLAVWWRPRLEAKSAANERK